MQKKGFTLIELMIVVAIIAILAMIAVPMYQRYIERSRNSAAQAVLQQLSTALVAFNVDHSTYPAPAAQATAFTDLLPSGFRPDGNVAMEYQTVGSGFVLYAVHKARGSRLYVYDNILASGVQPMLTATTTESGVTPSVAYTSPMPVYTLDNAGTSVVASTVAPTAATLAVDAADATRGVVVVGP